eukprot:COSAG01_NODE_5030_length_4536_cov_15.098715_3_plen_184_part_00
MALHSQGASSFVTDPLELTCPAGSAIKTVEFAQLGTQSGSCTTGFRANTTAVDLLSKVKSLCVGWERCTVQCTCLLMFCCRRQDLVVHYVASTMVFQSVAQRSQSAVVNKAMIPTIPRFIAVAKARTAAVLSLELARAVLVALAGPNAVTLMAALGAARRATNVEAKKDNACELQNTDLCSSV